MENKETKKVKLEVEIPSVIYMALIENKMRDQNEIMERVRQGVVEVFYKMYSNPSFVPVPLKQYFEANYGEPPELHIPKGRSKRKKVEASTVESGNSSDIIDGPDQQMENSN